ncbi:50S ribosomal protein L23 [Candidatus Berkelbacteria bacterium CG08_land_8_20_14_0_20_39_8]|uniref:Large ribosomal subunit protein uL23 n=1 Tax=Candidatus Berkelbacteria bacterium CG08_land_8_20_14_0_20_39_8 TaxID=1974511 RepID=A0A2M6YCG2_9BACT|nr:MAG: 50S ribosomal protein L23 [Candidatus Berkelbacteria bacterium CG08_land_8_20_14_0_20_39_8]
MNNLKIKKPIISEKSFALASEGVYVFLVENNANKNTVATQVHKMYKVDVVSVNIINILGKVKKTGRKIGKRSDIKKALVKVKKGQKIAIFEEEAKKADKKPEKSDGKDAKLKEKPEEKPKKETKL